MINMRNYSSVKAICLILVLTFISLDISWAYPAEINASSHSLAIPSAVQTTPVTPEAAKFQQSVFATAGVVGSASSIARYLLGDPEHPDVNPLPLEHLEQVLTAELGSALEGIDLSKVMLKDGVVYVPYNKGGEEYIIQIALKNNLAIKDLAGYEWVISDKYVVKRLPKDFREEHNPTKTKTTADELQEKPKVIISEPVAEVTIKTARGASTFGIKAIIKSFTLILFMASVSMAGEFREIAQQGPPNDLIAILLLMTILFTCYLAVLSGYCIYMLHRYFDYKFIMKGVNSKDPVSITKLKALLVDLTSHDSWKCSDAATRLLRLKEISSEPELVEYLKLVKLRRFQPGYYYPLSSDDIKIMEDWLIDKVDIDVSYRAPSIHTIPGFDYQWEDEVVDGPAYLKIKRRDNRDSDRGNFSGISLSIEPFTTLLFAAGAISLLSWLKDFAFAHPMITIGIMLAAGLMPIIWYVAKRATARKQSSNPVRERFYHDTISDRRGPGDYIFGGKEYPDPYGDEDRDWKKEELERMHDEAEREDSADHMDNNCIEPFTVGLLIATIVSVLSAIRDFAFAHPVVSIGIALGVISAPIIWHVAKYIAAIKRQGEVPGRTKICFVGVGSPTHFNMWNNLSVETLIGDLRGYFKDKVSIDVYWTNNAEEVGFIVKDVMAQSPSIIGVSVQPGSMDIVQSLVEKLNGTQEVKDGTAKIVFGNQIPTYIPEKFIGICPQGIVVRGEGEIAMRGIVKAARGELELSAVPSIVYKDAVSGKIIHTPIAKPDLISLAYPPSTDTYKEIISRGGNVQVQASRGCPWGGCVFCTRTSFRRGGTIAETGGTASWEGFSVERVLKTLDEVMSRGVTEVDFADDEFIGGRKEANIERIVEIARGIEELRAKYNIGFSFRIFTRPNIIYREGDPDSKNAAMEQLLLALKRAGLVKIFIGIEAGNESQLKRYMRGMKLTEVTESIKILRRLGIGIDAGFIMFDPELTIGEMLQNVKYFRENGLIEYNQWPFRSMAVNHGSRMVGRLERGGLIGAENENLMSYEYRFEHESVKIVADIVNNVLSGKTRGVFYALKQKAKKYFDPAKRDDEIILCQKYVEDNGIIYLDLMEELGKAVLNNASREDLEGIARKCDNRVLGLAQKLFDDIVQGKIADGDGYLKKELAELGIGSVIYDPSAGQEKNLQFKKENNHTKVGEPDVVKATQLFELVENTINNRKARLVKNANEVIAYFVEKHKFLDATLKIDKKEATAEIRRRMKGVIARVDSLQHRTNNVPEDILAKVEDMRKNIDQLEADSIVASIIILGRRAKRQGEKLIIGLETEWIPGMHEKGYGSQHDAINSLMAEIMSLGDDLRKLGLDNVEIIEGASQTLADAVRERADKTNTKLSNVVVLASNDTINSTDFDSLRSTREEEKAFLAGIDTKELFEYYRTNKTSLEQFNRQIEIEISKMLSIALELATGKEPPKQPGLVASYDKVLRVVVFLPKIRPVNYRDLVDTYKAKTMALQAA